MKKKIKKEEGKTEVKEETEDKKREMTRKQKKYVCVLSTKSCTRR